MSSRNNMIAVGALAVLGACLTWLLSNRDQNDQGAIGAPNAGQALEEVKVPENELSEPVPRVSGATVPVEGEVLAEAAAAITFDVGLSEDGWPLAALEFADEADPDPVLSRHLETEVYRLVDTMLDRRRYEAHSVTCRGPACQVLTRDREPDPIPTAGPHSYDFIAPILRGMSSSGIRDPTTGANLMPKLELVRGTRGSPAGIEFLVVFTNP